MLTLLGHQGKRPDKAIFWGVYVKVFLDEVNIKISLCFELWCWRRLLRVPWTARRSNQSILKKSVLNIHWKDRCWNWSSNTLATWCEELPHWKRLWCWERLKARGEGDDRGWDGWMASPTQWTWIWVSSGSLWWTGRPGVLQSMGSQRVRHDWVTELTNWLNTGGWIISLSKMEKRREEINQDLDNNVGLWDAKEFGRRL